MEKKTAVIIGAGPAGLTAAYKLLTETDIKPIILEESEFIGGISRTAQYGGNRMDIGGHRFFTKIDEVNELWEHFMPMQGAPSKDDILLKNEKALAEGGPDPEKTDKVMLRRRRVSRIYYLHKFFDYPISMKAETFKNMGFGRTMKAGFGYVWSSIFKKKEDSLRNFYINRFGKPLYEMFFEDYTEKLWGVNPSEIPADWGAQIDEVNELWEHFMPMQGAPSKDDILLKNEKALAEGGPDPEKTDKVMLRRRRVSRIYYLHKFFDYPISMKAETFKNMGFGRTMKAGFGYVWSSIFKKKEDSLRNFYINRFGKPLYEMFFEDYTEKLWGVNPSEIPADWGAQRVKGLSLMKAVWSALAKPFKKKDGKVETSLIEEFSYPKKGPGQLYEEMADEIRALGGEIIMNSRVMKIDTDGHDIKSVTAMEKDGEKTYTGDVFFSTMPIKDLVSGMGSIVPEDVRDIALNLPYRDFMTVGLLVNKLKIKNKTKFKTVGDIVPDCWIYIQEREVKLGRLQIFNNWSPYMVEDFENTVWIGLEYFCNEGDEYWNMSDGDFIAFATDELAKIGVIDKADVLDSVRIRVKKAYPAYFGSYNHFGQVREYLDGIENLWCLGRNGQHRYNNMDHSIMTAIEAVRAVAAGKTSKAEVWGVNTEKEYHEEKAENGK